MDRNMITVPESVKVFTVAATTAYQKLSALLGTDQTTHANRAGVCVQVKIKPLTQNANWSDQAPAGDRANDYDTILAGYSETITGINCLDTVLKVAVNSNITLICYFASKASFEK